MSGSGDKIVLWDTTSWKVLTSSLPTSGVRRLTFSPDGQLLAIAGWSQQIDLLDSRSLLKLRQFRGHEKWINSLGFSPDGKLLVSGGADGAIKVWAADPQPSIPPVVNFGTEIAEWDGGNWGENLSPGGRHFITVRTNGEFSVWESASLREGARLPVPLHRLRTIALNGDGRIAAFGSYDGDLALVEYPSGRVIWTNHFGLQISRIAFSEDGATLAVGAWGDTFVFDTATWQQRYRESDPSHINHLAFSRNRTLLIGHYSGAMKIVTLGNPPAVSTLPSSNWQVGTMELLADRQMFFSSSRETLQLWDFPAGTPTTTLKTRPATALSSVVSPDRRRLVTGLSEGSITIWDLDTLRELATLEHQGGVHHLAFLPDGETLISLNHLEARLWRADSNHPPSR